jgi:N-formylmaleamate deformylase
MENINLPTLAQITPPHWQKGVVVLPDATEIFFIRSGAAKPPVLLLHGVQASGAMWLRTAQALEQDYDVFMPDFRGHGGSSRIGGSISTELLVADMIALIEHLGLEQLSVIGHSMGADIAGRLAAMQPLRALVLVDPALLNIAAAMAVDFDNPPPWMARLFADIAALQTQTHAERMQTARRLQPPDAPVWDAIDYAGYVQGLAHFDLAFYRSIGSLVPLYEVPAILQRIACPTLLLTARPMRPDLETGPGLQAFHDHLANIRHIPIAESGHFIMFDQFDQFIGVVRAFLAQQISGRIIADA